MARQIHREANDALRKAGIYAAVLGLGNGVILGLLIWARAIDKVTVPALFAAIAGGYSLVIYFLARAGRIRGWTVHVVFIPFVSLPTLFFLISHFMLPAGAATYLTGPISYLYFFLILMTGFLFDARVSIASGVVSGAGYLAMYGLAAPTLARIRAPDPTLYQDLTATPIYVFKAVMMVFAGLVVGALAVRTRKLILGVLAEQESRQRIDRLFGQYVSDEVKDRLVHDTQESVGEQVSLAVLFSDIRGYSTFSEGRSPEAIVSHLNRYFDRMVECIRTEGGVVDKFIGDAVMAVFGGVAKVDDPCAAALRAARAMRRALAELNQEWAAAGEPTFDNGVGIDYGKVLQGPIGSLDRKEFTVIGDPVNTASRVEGLTKEYPHHIIVTADVHARLDPAHAAALINLGEAQVKGKLQPVALYGVPENE